MTKKRPYHIPNRRKTIATYWLIQWGVITAAVWYMMVVSNLLFDTRVVFADAVIPGLLWAVTFALLQAAFLAAPEQVAGRRERSKLRAFISIGVGAAGATGLCSLVIVVSLMYVGFASGSLGLVFLFTVATPIVAVGLFVCWSCAVRRFVRRGRLEARYLQVAAWLLKGTIACAIACAGIAAIAMVIGQDTQLLAIGLSGAPWLIGAAIALLGCRLYLKRLWIVRAPWYETHCAECGYDLSGNLAVTQCSECGTPWRTHPEPGDPSAAQARID